MFKTLIVLTALTWLAGTGAQAKKPMPPNALDAVLVSEEMVTTPSESDVFQTKLEEAVFRLTNAERQKAGLAPLEHSHTMQNYARLKVKDMADRNYFGHGDPDGKLIQHILDADGVKYYIWGENLALLGGFDMDTEELAALFLKNWMESPTHRDNILSSEFTQVGIGVVKAGERLYAAQEFMRPPKQ